MRLIAKLFGIIITLPILLVAISFAISNTDILTLHLWPFSTEVSLPTALALFIVLIFGFLIGAVATFLGAGSLRRRVRNAEYRLRQMEMEQARIAREKDATAAKAEKDAIALAQRPSAPALAAE
ncbi:MAG: lipopolysaccharide assembly protein LapA domain-containing protein [Alphaproteobacteria bacterium]|nr:lipopolysaccharide assembly protein LapA domain-containing protein [Alphaproteobacteria bacterium]